MQIIRAPAELRACRASLPAPVGLVPTMGYLHEGHLSLVRRARAECASVIGTLFVNPTQFGPHEDFATYPRDEERDFRLFAAAGTDVVFAPPSVETMYPPGFSTYVVPEGPARRWEGEWRPGHFRGVATIVAKLFILASADRAYFGEKDYQQLQVVTRLAADLNLPTEVVGCPIVREPDGLALSSRNVYLTPEERPRAVALYAGLRAAQEALLAGERDARVLEQRIAAQIAAHGLTLDYAAVVDPRTLEPVERVEAPARALVAARLGKVRLIDNLALFPPL